MAQALTDLQLIKKLEKTLNLQFKQFSLDEIGSLKENAFSINDAGQVTGLNIAKIESATIPELIKKLQGIKKLTLIETGLTDVSFLQKSAGLTYLDLTGNRVTNIFALKGLKTLTNLYLSGNQINDISPLRNLKRLVSLSLEDNKIGDISYLKGLTSLKYVDLSGNQFTEISALRDLSNITYLNLGNNQIKDISPLQKMNRLTYLNTSRNNIMEVSGLGGLKQLTYLNLACNQVQDISHLHGLTDLSLLDLGGNRVTDISAIKNAVHLRELNLAGNKFNDISALQGMTELAVLDLQNNRLTTISVLQSLRKLNVLKLNSNQLTDISALRSISTLKRLELGKNQLTDISALQALTQLEELYLDNNQLTDISALQSLKKLKDLRLYHNRLADIRALQSLNRLKELRLEYNLITDISALHSLTQLEILHIGDNELTDISSLRSLTRLTVLRLYNNCLIDISALRPLTRLHTLDLRHNRISHLPPAITGWEMNTELMWADMSFFGGINLFGNPLKTPPVEIVKQGLSAVTSYYDELQKDNQLSLHAKLLIVGGGEVGKTTIMRTLTEPDFQLTTGTIGKEKTIHGIHIKPWKLTCPLEGDTKPSRELTLYTWDFGGQDIYLSTHQFFLTKRSLYIFVWEARKEKDSSSIDYWLNVIKLLSAGSPVIVVMNKADKHSIPIDEAAYRSKFKNIAAFLQVSCLTRGGIDRLNRTIRDVLTHMPHLKDKLPKAWSDIRDTLQQENRYYIDAQDYYQICRNFALGGEDRADLLSGYLHDLGVIVRFRYDPILKNTIILKPEWITEAIYKLLDTRQILDNKGRFTFDDLSRIWDPVKHPGNTHQWLIRLMEKFELCFNFTGTATYIVPGLVPAQSPGGIQAPYLQNAGTLRFQYHYDFMPKGVLGRFIARNYYLIKEEAFWQNGVKLAFEESDAMLVGDPPKRRLRIWVRGPQKTELLAIIRNELNHIHTTLNMKKEMNHYREEVPCNCSHCLVSEEPHLFPVEVLKKMSERGNRLLTCFKSYEDVSPDMLLRGYMLPQRKETILDSLLVSASLLQGKALSIHPDEESRTGFMAQLLKARGHHVEEAVLWGRSPSGKNLGEVDLKFDDLKGKTISIGEAFSLSYFGRDRVSQHLKRIFSYDIHGLPENFILVYVDSRHFEKLWEKYCAYLEEVDYPFALAGKMEVLNTGYAGIKCSRTAHVREGKRNYLYHLFIHMPQKR